MFSVGGSAWLRPDAPMRHHPCVFLILTLNQLVAGRGQYLVGSLSGADAFQNVTKAFIKVGLGRMEIGLKVQRQKPA